MDVHAALADASTVPFWLDTNERPTPLPPLTEDRDVDLLVVGGGFTGLWTALQAKERDPNRHIVLVEANSITVPLFDPATVPDPNISNSQFVKEYTANLLKNAFPHVQK